MECVKTWKIDRRKRNDANYGWHKWEKTILNYGVDGSYENAAPQLISPSQLLLVQSHLFFKGRTAILWNIQKGVQQNVFLYDDFGHLPSYSGIWWSDNLVLLKEKQRRAIYERGLFYYWERAELFLLEKGNCLLSRWWGSRRERMLA